MRSHVFFFRNWNKLLAGILVALAGWTLPAQVTPDEAISRLSEGQGRYLSGQLKKRDFLNQRESQRTSQNPYAIVLTCSDSRVPPEVIFDEDLGQLFVVRLAGNIVDSAALGSIEYAAEHLGVPLLVVMGHTQCGAVKACYQGIETGSHLDGIIEKIKPAVAAARQDTEEKLLQAALSIRYNVLVQVTACWEQSPVIRELAHSGRLKILAGVYEIETGRYRGLDDSEIQEGIRRYGAPVIAGRTPASQSKPEGKPASLQAGAGAPHPVAAPVAAAPSPAPAAGTGTGGEYNPQSETIRAQNIFSDGRLFCVQVAAYVQREMADADVTALRARGHQAFVTEGLVKGRTWYRVRVGFFQSAAEAKRYRQSIKTE